MIHPDQKAIRWYGDEIRADDPRYERFSDHNKST